MSPVARRPRHATSALLAALAALAAGCGTPARKSTAATPSAERAVALTHATLVDGTGAAPRADVTIVVRGRRIAEVYPSGDRPPPAAAEVHDARGRWVIPGLIDAHVHLGTSEERPASATEAVLGFILLGGVTAVRDMGGRAATVRPLAARAVHDTTAWPRIYLSAIVAGPGMWFEGRRGAWMAEGGEPGHAPLVRRVDATTDLREVMATARAAGATGVKIYDGVDPRLLPAIVAEAHRAGLRAWSHLAVAPGRPGDLVRAGVDAVTHADQFIAEVFPWPDAALPRDSARALRHRAFLATRLDTAPLDTLLAEMRRRGTLLDPTLYIMTPRPDSTGRVSERGAALYRFATTMTRRAHAAGVPIVAGTDAIGGSSPNLHVELQLLVDSAGLSPMAALQAATLHAARAIGAEDSIGTVEPGKLADLVLLRADPLADIANTLTVEAVMKSGRLHHRSAPIRTPPMARAPR